MIFSAFLEDRDQQCFFQYFWHLLSILNYLHKVVQFFRKYFPNNFINFAVIPFFPELLLFFMFLTLFNNSSLLGLCIFFVFVPRLFFICFTVPSALVQCFLKHSFHSRKSSWRSPAFCKTLVKILQHRLCVITLNCSNVVKTCDKTREHNCNTLQQKV